VKNKYKKEIILRIVMTPEFRASLFSSILLWAIKYPLIKIPSYKLNGGLGGDCIVYSQTTKITKQKNAAIIHAAFAHCEGDRKNSFFLKCFPPPLPLAHSPISSFLLRLL
jgi:hypothetical protein